MRVSPILFSGPMVRANLRETEEPGTGKTQTRRVLKQVTPEPDGRWRFGNMNSATIYAGDDELRFVGHLCPYIRFKAGDILYVRETWGECDSFGGYLYRATHDGDDPVGNGWRPSIHMPRKAARLTLEVTDVRVERLQDISEADALAEGVCQFCEDSDRPGSWKGLSGDDRATVVRAMYGSAVRAYSHLWDTINGAGAWDANPWVVAVTYRPHLINVDAFQAIREAA